MKCLRSLVGVLQMDRVRIEEVHWRAIMERELASLVDQSFKMVWAHGENGVLYDSKGVDGGCKWRAGTG